MRPTCAHVNLKAIRDNYRLACSQAPQSKTIAVIKSNAYGHGMIEVARDLEPIVPAFAVAMIDEAVRLRDAGIKVPVLILQGVNTEEDLRIAAHNDFWLMLHHRKQVETLINAALARPVRAWLKLDTGMHRLGLPPEEFELWYQRLLASDNLKRNVVVCTHLACADELGNETTPAQLSIIKDSVKGLKLPLSIANSAAILYWPDSHAEWNRPGIMLYGSCPTGSKDIHAAGLKPAMTLTSEIIASRQIAAGEGVGYGHDWVATRPSTIGTIAIGYGDGYPRHAASGTPVLVNGRRVPLVGRVSMDAISVDLSDAGDVSAGDPVELWGDRLSVNEVAASAGTISYELLAGMSGRVPIRYDG